MKAAIHQIQFMPGLRFFSKMRSADVFVLLDDVQYEKREFQNRNRIKTPSGAQYLTVPVITKGRREQKINEVLSDNELKWRQEHLKAIKLNYAKAPYFKEYMGPLEEIYSAEYPRLCEIALKTVDFLAGHFGITTPRLLSSTLNIRTSSTRRLVDICGAVKADVYLSGTGARDYLDEKLFSEAGIKLEWQEFGVKEYPQRHGPFVENLSALDLLFNCGPESGEYL